MIHGPSNIKVWTH
jgi:hypothetical protein